jgi:Amt family ammonium transporter
LDGSLLIGFFADPGFFGRVDEAGEFAHREGVFLGGNLSLFGEQLLANGVTIVYSFVVTGLIMLALKATIGIRVSDEVETSGLDLAEHAETAYHSGAAVSALSSSSDPSFMVRS